MLNVTAYSPTDFLLASNLFHFVFCIILVSYMIHAVRIQSNSSFKLKFIGFMALALACLITDMLSYVFDMQSFPGARLGNHISMFLSVFLTALLGTKWLCFFDTIFRIEKNKVSRRIICYMPTFLTLVMLVVNLFTGYIYTIGPDNVYTRGEGYWISFVLQYISFVLMILKALIYDLEVKTIRRKRMRNGILWLSGLTVVFGVMQALLGGVIALHCLGITTGIFIMFVRFQDDQITIDTLTALNNRYALDTYLSGRMKDYVSENKKNQTLYFIMMDIDKFKLVNDLYGHQEGDEVLRSVALKLKKVGLIYKSGLFLARYAGDEFAAVYETADPKAVRRLIKDIKAAVSEIVLDDMTLTISVGTAAYAGKDMPMEQLFELADKALYIDKFGAKDNTTEE